MKVLCAWCNKSLGEKPPLDDTRTSHGICPECAEVAREGFNIFPVRCDCGWFGMNEDCAYMRCPWCGDRVRRDTQVPPFGKGGIPELKKVERKCVEVKNVCLR